MKHSVAMDKITDLTGRRVIFRLFDVELACYTAPYIKLLK